MGRPIRSGSRRRRLVRRSGIAVVGVATWFVLANCSVDPVEGELAGHDGPLKLGGDQGTVCMLPSGNGQYTFAQDVVENSTDDDIRIDSIALVGAKNAAIVGGFIAPFDDLTTIGIYRSWPPQNPSAAFEQKRSAPTMISPGKSENVVVHLSATDPAEVEAIEVAYTHDGKVNRVRNSTAIQVRDDCL